MTPVSESTHLTSIGWRVSIFCWTVCLIGLSLVSGITQAEDADARWQQIKTSLFGDQKVHDGSDFLALETPYRALDAAVVPIVINTKTAQTPERFITRLHLLIDMNPSPVAAVFNFPHYQAWDKLATRVRVNAYTHVRAVARTSDGELFMTANFVKASGGCSAPALKDPDEAARLLGKMKILLPDQFEAGDPLMARILIKHPNSSGLQFDQVTRQYIPADFVRTIQVSYNGQPLFSVDADISISEDPSINFGFVAEDKGELDVHVTDSQGRDFRHSFAVNPGSKGS